MSDQGQGHGATLIFFSPFTTIQTVRSHNSTLVEGNAHESSVTSGAIKMLIF